MRSAHTVAGCLLLALATSVAAVAQAPDLFTSSALRGYVDPMEAGVLRAQTVEVNADLLGGQNPDPERTVASLRLALPESPAVVAERQQVMRNPTGSVSWVGKVAGDPLSSVVLVTREGITVGSVRTAGRTFQLVYLGDGAHAITEIDEDSPAFIELPPTEVTLPAERVAAAPTKLTARAQDDGSVIDLMVLYTANAANSAGGAVAMENRIDLGVTETNLSYQNSDVNPTLNLVHVYQTTYVESGSSGTDRNRLRAQGDGFLDEAHTLRDEHGADLVKLVVDFGGCGIAYIMTNVSTAFESSAFCVTQDSCISPNYTFAHELGHIQSARHDWTVDGTNNSPFTFNHGYTDPNNQWRTVMAYSTGCGGCQRQLYWSNPNVNHPGNGNAMGRPDGMSQAADNHRTLNETAWTVANFRVSIAGLFSDSFESGGLDAWDGTNLGG